MIATQPFTEGQGQNTSVDLNALEATRMDSGR